MAKIVNLNRARKARARSAETEEAARNRVLHGRTKAERTLSDVEAAQDAARLDGHKREPDS